MMHANRAGALSSMHHTERARWERIESGGVEDPAGATRQTRTGSASPER
jgi:hypothetical protein